MTKRIAHNNFNHLNEVFAYQKRRARDENWPHYQIFGLNMASDYAFGKRLLPGESVTDLIFTCKDTLPEQVNLEMMPPLFASQQKSKKGESIVSCWQVEDFFLMRYTEIADYYLWQDGVVCLVKDFQQHDLAAVHVSPGVLALWLELYRGVPSLHGCGVKINNSAVVFLGQKGAGKSTMAISFAQAGYPLLSDDTLPVEECDGFFRVRPAYPQARLWPELIENYLDDQIELEMIQSGYAKQRALLDTARSEWFCNQALPIACVYLLQRCESVESVQNIEFSKLSQRDSLVELIRFSIFPRIGEALGLSPVRMLFFSKLLRDISIYQLAYPNKHTEMKSVHNAIISHLSHLD